MSWFFCNNLFTKLIKPKNLIKSSVIKLLRTLIIQRLSKRIFIIIDRNHVYSSLNVLNELLAAHSQRASH